MDAKATGGRIRAAILGAALVGVVGWGAFRTIRALVAEAQGSVSRLTRFESAAERDARLERGLGRTASLFRLVRAHVPEDGTVFLSREPDPEEHPALPAVQRFLCPRAWLPLDRAGNEGFILVLPGDVPPVGSGGMSVIALGEDEGVGLFAWRAP